MRIFLFFSTILLLSVPINSKERCDSLSIEECSDFSEKGLYDFIHAFRRETEFAKVKNSIQLELGKNNFDLNKIEHKYLPNEIEKFKRLVIIVFCIISNRQSK